MRRALVLLGVLGVVAGCGGEPAAPEHPAEPGAAAWAPWAPGSLDGVRLARAPASGATHERGEADDERTLRRARFWAGYPVTEPWTRLHLELVSEQVKNPPRAARGYALASVAVHDALVAAERRRRTSGRRSDAPDVAVVAGAASRVLAHLFDDVPAARFDVLAERAAASQRDAGLAQAGDLEVGLDLGRAVAERVVEHARGDGSARAWHGRPPEAGGAWRPPPGMVATPVEPLAGRWRTWVATPAQMRVPPPPAWGSQRVRAEAQEVLDAGRRLTDEQGAIARRWDGGQGTSLPPGQWNEIALREVEERRLSLPRVARVFATLNVALADAGVAAWRAKYEHWTARPENAIGDLGLARDWKPLLETPIFPAYVSGHATFSAAAAEVLAHEFPDRAGHFRRLAAEAAASRLYGGIHFRSDNEEGLRLGRRIGRLVTAHAAAAERARESHPRG
jgi:hypothetical protein